MPNTITAFHSFTANTKAKASQVNTNFSNYRGTILPVNELTITASDNSHDLGTSDHNFRSAYIGTSLIVAGLTTTANATLENDGSTGGAFEFNINSSVTALIPSGGIAQLSPFQESTVTCDTVGQIALSESSSSLSISGSTYVTLNAQFCTVKTNGRPVLIQMQPAVGDSSNAYAFYFGAHGTLSDTSGSFRVALTRDGTQIASWNYLFVQVAGSNSWRESPQGQHQFIDTGVLNTSGTFKYEYLAKGETDTDVRITIDNIRTIAVEI